MCTLVTTTKTTTTKKRTQGYVGGVESRVSGENLTSFRQYRIRYRKVKPPTHTSAQGDRHKAGKANMLPLASCFTPNITKRHMAIKPMLTILSAAKVKVKSYPDFLQPLDFIVEQSFRSGQGGLPCGSITEKSAKRKKWFSSYASFKHVHQNILIRHGNCLKTKSSETNFHFHSRYRLVGLVDKVPALRVADLGFDSHLCQDFWGQVKPVTSKLVLQWLLRQAPGVIGSALGLNGPVPVYCDWVR